LSRHPETKAGTLRQKSASVRELEALNASRDRTLRENDDALREARGREEHLVAALEEERDDASARRPEGAGTRRQRDGRLEGVGDGGLLEC